MELSKETTKRIAYLIILAGVVLAIVFHLTEIFSFIHYLWNLIFPFIVGFAIAFILNIIVEKLENTLFKNLKKGKRFFSFALTLIIVLGIIILVCFIVGPELIRSIQQIGKQLPTAYDRLIVFLKDNRLVFGGVFKDIIDSIIKLDINFQTVFTNIKENWQTIFHSGYSIISSTISSLYTFFVGFVFSIYLLFSKETLSRQTRTFVSTLLGKKRTDAICDVLTLSSKTFSNFISCQCLEACILGMMFFVSMNIFQMPYALLLSIVIALTALIPVFGAFIGCFIGIILIGITDPMQALWFLVLFLVLQQIEGNFIYPHVVGSSVGLPSIWVFVAVIIGGSVMGVFGMFIFIPLTSIIYTLCRNYIRNKRTKDMQNN